MLDAISSFGAPVGDLNIDDFSKEGTVFQIGLPPLRIDVLTGINGVQFADAWADRSQTTFGNVPVFIISRHHLIINKRAVGRLQDLADAEELERAEGLH